MARMELTLETLADFDFGKASVAFQQALRRAVADCLDRPGDKSPRKVTLTTSIIPLVQQDGDVVEAHVDFKIAAAVPPWQTAKRPVQTTRQGQLFFRPDAPDNPSQKTLDEAE